MLLKYVIFYLLLLLYGFFCLIKVKSGGGKITAIAINNDSFSWVKPLQELLKSEEFRRVILYSQNQSMSGIVGLVNCIIKEGYSEKAK